MNLKQIITVAISLLALGATAYAEAATTYNWTWATTASGNPPSSSVWCSGMTSTSMSTYGNCAQFSGSETPASPLTNNLQVRAYSNTGPGSGQSTYDLQTAYLSFWGSSGVGVVSQSEGSGTPPSATNPDHSVDNNGRYDSILLSFDRAVSLTGVDIGWFTNDSDITVLALTGGSYSELAGKDYGSLASLGWTLVGNYNASNSESISTTQESRYWLVGARNPVTGGSGADSYKDYVKIAGFTARETYNGKVPEPGAMSMAVVALAGGAFISLRRRSRRAAA